MERLAGKVILISGEARGQGAAEARICVVEVARLVLFLLFNESGHIIGADVAIDGGATL